MTVFTSYWNMPLPSSVLKIGISRGTPRRYPAGYRTMKELAPGAWFNQVAPDQYMALYYREILKPLDLDAVLRKAENLAAQAGKPDVALLCYEKPRFTMDFGGGQVALKATSNWCHRRAVAAAYERRGLIIPEYGTTAETVGAAAEDWIRDRLALVMQAA